MQMFETLLNSIPKNRSEMVNDLEIPEVTIAPYFWTDNEESLINIESEFTAGSDDFDAKTLSTDLSLPLSRAMTDSEIDYGRYRRYKSRRLSDLWSHMDTALNNFLPAYLASLNSFQESRPSETDETMPKGCERFYNEELKMKMERFFDEECRVFTPDDPALNTLEKALKNLHIKDYEIEPHQTKP